MEYTKYRKGCRVGHDGARDAEDHEEGREEELPEDVLPAASLHLHVYTYPPVTARRVWCERLL